jgi:hypothetical protein
LARFRGVEGFQFSNSLALTGLKWLGDLDGPRQLKFSEPWTPRIAPCVA